jgi:DNA-binding response OmpR family regulator
MFNSSEYIILTAGSGEKVLGIFNGHPETSLVIITAELGDSNGFEVLRQMKSCRSGTPVFLLAAYISFESLKLASLYGCDELLQIPVRKRELMAVVNKYLHHQ